MKVIKAKQENIADILEIYEKARAFMKANGNPNQWVNYPNIDTVNKDLEADKLYICVDKNAIVGVFFYEVGIDKCYNSIDGAWLDHKTHGVVHRIATLPDRKGVGRFCLDYVYRDCGNIRIDTHKDNKPMRNLLEKLGFVYCGIITLESGDTRLAYQKNMDNSK